MMHPARLIQKQELKHVNDMKYMVLDLETETHHRFKRKSNSFLPENYIVARGWKVQGDKRCSAEFFDSKEEVQPISIPKDVDVLVAHNAKFELLYEMRFSSQEISEFFKRGGKIHCTQYAEYLINAQQQEYHMNSLNDTAKTYGGRAKIDGMKELWDAGYLTSEIDRDLLLDYLIGTEEEGRNSGDIGNTELIYLGQLKAIKTLGMEQSIKARMDGLCATAEMEYNGLKIDVERARRDLKERLQEQKEADEILNSFLPDLPKELAFNWNSPIHKSAIIFGGTVKYQKQTTYTDPETGELARKKAVERQPLFHGSPVPLDNPNLYKDSENEDALWKLRGPSIIVQDTFKSGKKIGEGKFRNVQVPGELKVKYQDFFFDFPGYIQGRNEWLSVLTDGKGGPVYSTSADVQDEVTKLGSNVPFLKALSESNKLHKEIGTYYYTINKSGVKKGMLTCVQPWDHIIHHKLNHTSTVTSRLSSSDPNLQNITRADFDSETGKYKSTVKAMFTSRFGEEGVVAELDYSQLEVIGQGLLTRDKNLIRDLNSGVDFHCKRVALKNHVSYEFALNACKNEDHPEFTVWKKERTKCKVFSFQRSYGAGAQLIAADTGMSIEEVKALIELEEQEYPGITKFNKKVDKEVNETAEPFHDHERGFRVFRKGTYQSPTGTLYTFRSYDAPSYLKSKGYKDTFSPTEMKNYPVQGLCGELVQLVLGKLWRWFLKNDNFGDRAFLINTVHDSVWIDVHNDVKDEVLQGAKRIMEAIPWFLKKEFNLECPVKFPVDIETGPNMLEKH